MTLDVTSVDLSQLTQSLGSFLGSPGLPASLLEGKTALREATQALLHCSELEAENIVDTLVARGFAQFREERELPGGAGWFLLDP